MQQRQRQSCKKLCEVSIRNENNKLVFGKLLFKDN